MEAEERRTVRRGQIVFAVLLAIALAVSALVNPVEAATLGSWNDIARDLAGIVLTIAAIWLGMLFGVAFERAGKGRGAGASDLVRHLMRPLRVGGLTLLGVLILAVADPYLDSLLTKVLPGVWKDGFARGRVFLSLTLCAGALYGLLLSLAPVEHIVLMLRAREAEADALPPGHPDEVARNSKKEPWQA